MASAATVTGAGASTSPPPGVSSSRLPRYDPRPSAGPASSRATSRRRPPQSVTGADFEKLLRWLRLALAS